MGRPELRRAWLPIYGALWEVTLASGLLVLLVPGARPVARELLGLSLTAAHNPPPSLGGVASIAANNILHSVWPLSLGLIDAQRHRFTRRLADLAVGANLVVAGVLVGSAVGGYGSRVLAFLVHVPLEWAGITLGSAGWTIERTGARRLSWHQRGLVFGATTTLQACAALVESLLAPHRS